MRKSIPLNRSRSALLDGSLYGRKRRGLNLWKIGFFVVAYAVVGLIIWQFNAFQTTVLSMTGLYKPTPTMAPLDLEREAQSAYLNGDLTLAITKYEQALSQRPNDIEYTYQLVRILIYRSYADVRNFADAEKALNIAQALANAIPDDSRVQTINCFALVRANGRTEDAVRACIRALDLNPSFAEAHAYLSMAYYDLGRYSTALTEAKTAVDLDPTSLDANLAYARALVFAGQFDIALEFFKKATTISPALEFPYYELASHARRMAIRRNDLSSFAIAEAAYFQVLNRYKDNVKAYTRLCQSYLEKSSRSPEDIRKAQAACERATEIDPSYSPAWRQLGEVYHSSRNYESAVEALDKCIQLEKNLPIDLREPTCWWLQAADYFVLGNEYCADSVETGKPGAVSLANEVLTWTTDTQAKTRADEIIRKCALAYQGLYTTPTPVPSPTSPPPPIL